MKSYINIHHSAILAADDDVQQFNVIDRGHQVRWDGATRSSLGYYGGYHYLIERNGVIKQYRKDSEVGAHNNVDEMNYKAIGVCFAGNMEKQNLSKEQRRAGLELVKQLQKKYSIPNENVQPHKKYKATACPGKSTLEFIEELKEVPLDWKGEIELWAGGFLKDPDGFFKKVENGHLIMSAIRKAIEHHAK